MSEKKIFRIDVAVDEPMYKAITGFAEADGISAPELIRMLLDTYLRDRRAYYARLRDIFGDADPAGYIGDDVAAPESVAHPRSKPRSPK